MADDDLVSRVRSKLLSDKIRLWLPPYTLPDGKKGQDPEELQKKYSTELEQPIEAISKVLEDLRVHAVNKLAARRRQESSGQNATLRVTLTESSGQKREATTLEVSLEDMTSSLRERIASYFDVPATHLKLISASKILDIRLSLAAQRIGDGGQVLAVLLSPEDAETAQKEEEKRNAADNLAKTRQAAEILARRLSVSPSVCLFVCLSVCLYICLFVYLSVCLSICLSVCLSFCLSVCNSQFASRLTLT
jgi:hypothetical protein